MLGIKEIELQYPGILRSFKKELLKEYIQYKILTSIFRSRHSVKLSFIGGTALRIMYGNTRFSEDLDFDNFGISENNFDLITGRIKKDLELEGCRVETKNIYKHAFRSYIRIPGLLYDQKLSGHADEKITIQFDTEQQGFYYKPDRKIINKFDVFSEIFVTPPEVLLAQKIYAAVNRKTPKGRDFYDIVFLNSFIKPSYVYLKFKIGVSNPADLKDFLIEKCSRIDFKRLVRDIRPFLFYPEDVKKVLLFPEYIKSANL